MAAAAPFSIIVWLRISEIGYFCIVRHSHRKPNTVGKPVSEHQVSQAHDARVDIINDHIACGMPGGRDDLYIFLRQTSHFHFLRIFD